MNLNENIFSKSVDWKEFVPYKHNEEFLDVYGSNINWTSYFKKYQKVFNYDFIQKYLKYFKRVDVIFISQNIEINEDINKLLTLLDQKTILSRKDINFSSLNSSDIVDWNAISCNPNLTEDYILENLDNLNLTSLAKNGLLPINIFEENLDFFVDKRNKISNTYLIRNKFPVDFINKYIDLFYVESLVCYQKLNLELLEKLIEDNKRIFNKVNLARIPTRLSASFIRKYLKDYNPYEFSRYQCSSEEVIEELSDMVSWNTISVFKILSDDFLNRHINDIDWIALFHEGENQHYHYRNVNFDNYVKHCKDAFPEKYNDYLENINQDDDFDYEDYDDY